MTYRPAQPICSRTLPNTTTFPFDPSVLNVGTEVLVGYAADTAPCRVCGGDSHVQVNGWMVITSGGLYWLDNDGVCIRTKSVHPFQKKE